MAFILYPNGITEEISPAQHVFTEEELLFYFEEYDRVLSFRPSKILNGWILWGELSKPDQPDKPFGAEELIEIIPEYYNKIISVYLKTDINSIVLFIHDTELHLDWKVTDDIIHISYDDFKLDIYNLLDDIAEKIIDETNQNIEEGEQKSIFLKQIGISDDKRIIFEMDPQSQPEQFYSHTKFKEFAEKILNFFQTDYNVSDNFSLYADKSIIISIHNNNVKGMINKLISFYNSEEKYENSQIISSVYNGWMQYTNQPIDIVEPPKPKRKRGRPRKNPKNEK